MGKYTTPSVSQFLAKKRIYGPKPDPVWDFLEKEMREAEKKGSKPYNPVVGEWLLFLKDLKLHYHKEDLRKKRRLNREVGPPWYYELSSHQREVLSGLKFAIHQDLLEDIPGRTRKALRDIGITLKLKDDMLMKCMVDSIEDPGIFIWYLYTDIYKCPPSEQKPAYDMNAKLIMSCMVFIDLNETTDELEKLTYKELTPPKPLKKKIHKDFTPDGRYGEYLQKNHVVEYIPTGIVPKPKKDLSIGYKFRLRSEESYENLIKDHSFMVKRKDRNFREKPAERICTYKFWEPPSGLRNVSKRMGMLAAKLKMLKKKARLRFHAPFENVQYQVGGVVFTKDCKPQFCLHEIHKDFTPDGRYGEYLQKNHVVEYIPTGIVPKPKKDLSIGYKFRLRSEESYENLIKDHSFMVKRKDRNFREKPAERICTYKFWEPPSGLRNVSKRMGMLAAKLKMLKKKARLRFHAPFENVQYQVGGVVFTKDCKPQFCLHGVCILPTGYIPINGGLVDVPDKGCIINILGHWKYPRTEQEKCDQTCKCLANWEGTVMEHVAKSKCKCGHTYDYYNEGKIPTEKYFTKPTRDNRHYFDLAQIYQLDPTEDLIKKTVADALMSAEPTPTASQPTISAAGLKEKDLLAAFLADLSDSPLLIPHLPKANLLNNLQNWVRKRVKGPLTKTSHKQVMLKSLRRWLDLKHMDFRARAYNIPFTLEELDHLTWENRRAIQKLFRIMLNNFVTRNRTKQLEQTRLWWSTMNYDAYPSKAFLDIFFTYMPGRMQDTFLINPYSSSQTPKDLARTCPLAP